jgi:hypothetical protein
VAAVPVIFIPDPVPLAKAILVVAEVVQLAATDSGPTLPAASTLITLAE